MFLWQRLAAQLQKAEKEQVISKVHKMKSEPSIRINKLRVCSLERMTIVSPYILKIAPVAFCRWNYVRAEAEKCERCEIVMK